MVDLGCIMGSTFKDLVDDVDGLQDLDNLVIGFARFRELDNGAVFVVHDCFGSVSQKQTLFGKG